MDQLEGDQATKRKDVNMLEGSLNVGRQAWVNRILDGADCRVVVLL
ncbi:uncharacterized protein J3R85_014466 [Psidium guajava]|nr:uncharacterized protein J3R85_014466 [Psidium guajava]